MPFVKFNELNSSERLIIPLKGVKVGCYDYMFLIDDKFFENLDYSEIKKGNLSVIVKLDKKPQFLIFDVKISGQVEVICDRCLDFFDLKIDYSGVLYGKFSDEERNSGEEYMVLLPSDEVADVTHFVYESIYLSLPVKRIHPNKNNGGNTCNKAMLKELKHHSKKKQLGKHNDPRWNELKELIN